MFKEIMGSIRKFMSNCGEIFLNSVYLSLERLILMIDFFPRCEFGRISLSEFIIMRL